MIRGHGASSFANIDLQRQVILNVRHCVLCKNDFIVYRCSFFFLFVILFFIYSAARIHVETGTRFRKRADLSVRCQFVHVFVYWAFGSSGVRSMKRATSKFWSSIERIGQAKWGSLSAGYIQNASDNIFALFIAFLFGSSVSWSNTRIPSFSFHSKLFLLALSRHRNNDNKYNWKGAPRAEK